MRSIENLHQREQGLHLNKKSTTNVDTNRTAKRQPMSWLENTCHQLQNNDSQLSCISVSIISLGGFFGIQSFASSLKYSTHLKSLEIFSCKIDIESLQNLLEGISSCNSLRHVKFGNCHSGGRTPQIVFEALSSSSTSIKHYLGDGGSDDDDDEHIQIANLESLELSGDVIDDCAAGALERMLEGNKTLRALKLGSMTYTSNTYPRRLLHGLVKNSTLTTLRLCLSNISDDFMVHLSDVLPQLGSLRILDLMRNKITDFGASLLAQALANDGVNCRLEVLCLAMNRLSSAGMQSFAQHLPQYKHLVELDLYDPEVMVPLEVFTDFAHSMQYNYTLHTLAVGCEVNVGEGCSMIDELRVLWEEPAYTQAREKLRFYLHCNQYKMMELADKSMSDCTDITTLLPETLSTLNDALGPAGVYRLLQLQPTVLRLHDQHPF